MQAEEQEIFFGNPWFWVAEFALDEGRMDIAAFLASQQVISEEEIDNCPTFGLKATAQAVESLLDGEVDDADWLQCRRAMESHIEGLFELNDEQEAQFNELYALLNAQCLLDYWNGEEPHIDGFMEAYQELASEYEDLDETHAAAVMMEKFSLLLDVSDGDNDEFQTTLSDIAEEYSLEKTKVAFNGTIPPVLRSLERRPLLEVVQDDIKAGRYNPSQLRAGTRSELKSAWQALGGTDQDWNHLFVSDEAAANLRDSLGPGGLGADHGDDAPDSLDAHDSPSPHHRSLRSGRALKARSGQLERNAAQFDPLSRVAEGSPKRRRTSTGLSPRVTAPSTSSAALVLGTPPGVQDSLMSTSPIRSPRVQPGKRRVKRYWTEEEEFALVQGVKQYGIGNWAVILTHFHNVFGPNNRTSVDLKDKYRNLKRSAAKSAAAVLAGGNE